MLPYQIVAGALCLKLRQFKFPIVPQKVHCPVGMAATLGRHLWVRSPQLGRTSRVLLHVDNSEQAYDLRQSLADCTEVTFIIPGDVFFQFSNAYLRTGGAGNPGIDTFYTDFASHLHESHVAGGRHAIVTISHVNHVVQARRFNDVGADNNEALELFSSPWAGFSVACYTHLNPCTAFYTPPAHWYTSRIRSCTNS
ncbi:unnamed protein product [Sphagnum balticum]